jgi:hypothetical protein
MNQKRDGDDNRIRFLEIEFVGGPYDGHKESCFTRPIHLPADVVWLVCEDVFRLLDGKDRCPGGAMTSVALYKLDADSGTCRYRFAGAVSVKQLTHSMRQT